MVWDQNKMAQAIIRDSTYDVNESLVGIIELVCPRVGCRLVAAEPFEKQTIISGQEMTRWRLENVLDYHSALRIINQDASTLFRRALIRLQLQDEALTSVNVLGDFSHSDGLILAFPVEHFACCSVLLAIRSASEG